MTQASNKRSEKRRMGKYLVFAKLTPIGLVLPILDPIGDDNRLTARYVG